jgi:hypothetical protein
MRLVHLLNIERGPVRFIQQPAFPKNPGSDQIQTRPRHPNTGGEGSKMGCARGQLEPQNGVAAETTGKAVEGDVQQWLRGRPREGLGANVGLDMPQLRQQACSAFAHLRQRWSSFPARFSPARSQHWPDRQRDVSAAEGGMAVQISAAPPMPPLASSKFKN